MVNRPKMPREERAKQFMPFAALKGYPEALRRREKIVVPKMEASEDYAEELDRKLHQVRIGDMISVTYFCKGEYIRQTGMVSGMDANAGCLRIVHNSIRFEDIWELDGNFLL